MDAPLGSTLIPALGSPVLESADWARLASLRRALAWAALDPQHLLGARYLGATCMRLLDEILRSEGLPADLRSALEEAREPMVGLDALDAEARLDAVRALNARLEALLPLSQAGARVPVALEPRAKLWLPQPEDNRGGRNEGRGEARPEGRSEGRGEGRGEPRAEARNEPRAEARNEPRAEGRSEPRPEAARPAPRGDGARAEPARAEPARAEPTRAEPTRAEPTRAETPAPPPDGGRLPLGHPDGTGLALSALPDIDPALVAALEAAGISTLADALMTAPVGFDRPPNLTLDDPSAVGTQGVVRGEIVAIANRHRPGQRTLELTIRVQGHRVVSVWPDGLPRRATGFKVGAEVALVGTLQQAEGRQVLSACEPVGMDGRGSGWLPLYNVEGVDDAAVRDLVGSALQRVLGAVKDPLPDDVLDRHRLLPLDEALRDAHFPANAAARGRARLAFEELLLVQIGLSRRLGRGQPDRGVAHKALHSTLGQLQVQYGLQLNDDQEAAFSEIRRDLLRSTPMTRVLQGDVGMAKGLVALMAAVLVAENRSQVAFVTSDASAAERQYLFCESMLRAVGIKPLYAGDSLSHAAADAIRRGEAAIVFGTHRLLQNDMEWRRLGLVVVLEQQEFASLSPVQGEPRGPRPDVLVVTSAPVPPQLLLAAYGPYEVSTIPRRTPLKVSAQVIPAEERGQAYEQVRDAVAAGRQALVMLPVRHGRDVLSREDAIRVGEALRADVLSSRRVAVYASDMPREERARVMDDFSHHRMDVLITTTSLEDGPPVPNLALIVVEHADKGDLIRLHRLRSYAGHSRRPGQILYVLSNAPTPESRRMVERVAEEGSRLEITDEDLNTEVGPRVANDVEPPSLTWAELPRDRDLLLEARAEGFRQLDQDPGLRRATGMRRLLSERWPELVGEAPLPSAANESKGSRKRRRRRRRR